jgi:hypothetical protein
MPRIIHNVVSDVLQQLEYTTVLRDQIRVNENDIRFTNVTIRYARDPEKYFTAEVFVDDDGDFSAMVLDNHNFSQRIMEIFMDTLMEMLTPPEVTDDQL